MRFPNAHKGLKKIKTSVVLEIISVVVMLVGAIISMVVIDKVGNGTAPAELTQYAGSIQFCMIAGGLVSVIAVTMRIVGAKNAGKDAEPFTTAYIIAIVSLLFSLFVNFFAQEGPLKTVVNYGSKLIMLTMLILVFKGIIELAQRLENTEMLETGKSKRTLAVILFVIFFVGDIVLSTVALKLPLALGIILNIAVSGISVAMAIVYLGYLQDAISMLEAAGPKPVPAEKAETETEEDI